MLLTIIFSLIFVGTICLAWKIGMAIYEVNTGKEFWTGEIID